ncbi:MAG: sterol desaturase family protein, partial [Myxococcota bacterium]
MSETDLPDVIQLSIPFFIVAILLELAVSRRHAGVRYETRDTFASLMMGTGRVVEGLVFGGISAAVLVFAHRFAPFDIPFTPWAFVVAFLIDDFRYYVYHRAAHRIRWFWAEHVNHHSSQHYNLSTALRQSWTGSLGGSVLFKVPLALVGFDPAMLLFVAGLNTVYQFWIHTEAIRRLPAPIEWIFNTPSHHRVHHARNPRYLDANYAGTLI